MQIRKENLKMFRLQKKKKIIKILNKITSVSVFNELNV